MMNLLFMQCHHAQSFNVLVPIITGGPGYCIIIRTTQTDQSALILVNTAAKTPIQA